MAQYEAWLQVSAGHGPVECAWAVLRVIERITEEAEAQGIRIRTLQLEPGQAAGTAQSALLGLAGEQPLEKFIRGWKGTVQWIARSPFRPAHRRKNWFVGVEAFDPVAESSFDLSGVRFETMRASGPGGQHVNRTESAVRVTHLSTGLQASASEERSQHSNRRLALARLAAKIAQLGRERTERAHEEMWRAHQELERGNPVRVFREDRAM